jgi:starch-binding outer membrane protein, SusD/RagB family
VLNFKFLDMKKQNRYFLKIMALLLMGCSACTKEFLDKKPDQALVVPQTLQDFQALLDNTQVNNLNMPALQEIASDDYYVTDASYASVTVPMYKNSYTWNKDIYAGSPDVIDWNYRYQQIFYANVVLEGLDKLAAADKASAQYNSEKGSALFFRGFALYQLSQLFCLPYVTATAAQDLGLPVRTSSDINQVSRRASVADSYAQVIADLQQSLALLPQQTSIKTRPTLAAGNGLLARVYLSMGDYADAQKYAAAALALYGTLLDYNTLPAAAAFPLKRFNDEVIFHSMEYGTSFSNVSRLLVDTSLYRSYQPGDLRLSLYFKPVAAGHTYKGSYSGSSNFFNGIATDELYLVKAECAARLGNAVDAMNDLNTLLAKRWVDGAFIPLTAKDANDALNQVLLERRKELLLRGLRWSDLRRLNQESARAVTLTRVVQGVAYTLPPNDPRYVLPVPDLVIQLSHIQQNLR